MKEQERKKTNKKHCYHNTALGSLPPSVLHSHNKRAAGPWMGLSSTVCPSTHQVLDFTSQHTSENNKTAALYFLP